MARDFNGSTDKILSTTAPITGYPFTLVCRFNTDSSANQFAVTLVDVSETAVYQGLTIGSGVPGEELLAVATSRNAGSPQYAKSSLAATTDEWHTAVAVFASATSRTVYLDGGNSGSNTGSISFGAGIDAVALGVLQRPSPAAFLSGALADVGIYNAAWTADDAAAYQAGYACSLIRPAALVFHAPLVRDLIEPRRGATLTATGTTVADHPRIILPRRRIIYLPATSAGETVVGTFSSAGISTVSLIGQAKAATTLASAGVATASFSTGSVLSTVLSVTSAALASFTGTSKATATLTSTGTASTSLQAVARIVSSLSASAAASVSFVGQSKAVATLQSSALASASFIGQSKWASTLTSFASSAASFISSTAGQVVTDGAAILIRRRRRNRR